jgi:queuine tRNA-ribosyltransferase/7-cyano-7-deazaguanine tRNA-ribosyltransferase
MIRFSVLAQSRQSRARRGILETAHGAVETPCFVTVATQAAIKTLSPKEAGQAGAGIAIANTFHLHLKPGEKIVKSHGGLHRFMNWPRPLMTDSGGFQVFSLGFGKDFGTGKIGKKAVEEKVEEGAQPESLAITEEGVSFRSFLDGREIFLDPKKSIRIQESLGADIMFAFDECTAPGASRAYTEQSLRRTHRWAKECLRVKKTDQALFGIVQGGKYKDFRVASARYIASLSLDGFGIGGEFGNDKKR